MNGLRSSFLRATAGINNHVLLQRQSWSLLSTTFQTIPQCNPIITKSSFSTSSIAFKTNTSTRTKENVHDLDTFFKLIGRNTIEHVGLFENDLSKFLTITSAQMKNMGIDVSTRRYMLRWRHKFVNDLEPLREHKRGKKKNGGERNAKTVIAKRKALQRLEEKEKNSANAEEEERIF